MLAAAAFTSLALAAPADASERPAIGGAAPLFTLRDLAGTPHALKDAIGKRGMVILFWAGWSDRSVEELRRLDGAAATLEANGVTIAAVNVERSSLDEAGAAQLREQVNRLHVRVPVLVDRGLELFHAYGVVTVPSTAVVDERGRLSYFLYGYSHEQREALFDAIDRVAGVARPPAATSSAPKIAPAALRRLQLGRLQLQQGHVEPARSSFEVAVEADQGFADPLVELAALAVDASDYTTASSLLDRAAAIDARHVAMRRERARLAALDGPDARLGDAQLALTELAGGGDAAAAAYLGYLLWAAGDTLRSESAFDRAKDISDVDPRAYIASAQQSVAAASRAMARYRREVGSASR
jgi:peroxiredoxin